MKRFNLIAVLVLFLFLLGSSLVLAQEKRIIKIKKGEGIGMKSPAMMPGGMMNCMDKLDLSDKQMAKIKAIRYEAKKEKIKLQAEIRLARLEVNNMMTAEDPSQNAILRGVDNLGKLKTEMKKIEIKKKFAIHQVLTKEQLEKMKKMKKGTPKMMMEYKMRGDKMGRKMGGEPKVLKYFFINDDDDNDVMDESEMEIEIEKQIVH